jgi:glycosyltransferase involved in cell wall biosynthesis
MPTGRPHVALNLVYLVPGEVGGMEIYARELIPALLAERPGLRLTALINEEASEAAGGPWGELIPAVTIPVKARSRVEWVRGEQQYVPRAAQRIGADVVHSLASTAPLTGRFLRVTTIHDLIYHHYPEAHFGLRSLGMRTLLPAAARRSHRVIAISDATRDDLIEVLGVPEDRIDVALNGVGRDVAGTPVAEADLRRELDLGDRRIVLSVSAKRPHKNLMRLLEAHAQMDAENRPVLIIPGYATPYEAELTARAQALGTASDVRFLGWVEGGMLEGLYAAADVFVFPSLYEGFGLPVLEAMRRGVPVACSDRSSLPQVAGDAALLFDPEDVASIRRAIERVLTDPAEAELMRAAGRAQAERFTWAATARATLASYDRALRGPTLPRRP